MDALGFCIQGGVEVVPYRLAPLYRRRMLGVDQVGPVSPDRPIGLDILAAKVQPFLDLSPLPLTARPERSLLTWSSSLGHYSSLSTHDRLIDPSHEGGSLGHGLECAVFLGQRLKDAVYG